MKSKDQKRREAIERKKATIKKYREEPLHPMAAITKSGQLISVEQKIATHERDIANTERKLLY